MERSVPEAAVCVFVASNAGVAAVPTLAPPQDQTIAVGGTVETVSLPLKTKGEPVPAAIRAPGLMVNVDETAGDAPVPFNVLL